LKTPSSRNHKGREVPSVKWAMEEGIDKTKKILKTPYYIPRRGKPSHLVRVVYCGDRKQANPRTSKSTEKPGEMSAIKKQWEFLSRKNYRNGPSEAPSKGGKPAGRRKAKKKSRAQKWEGKKVRAHRFPR